MLVLSIKDVLALMVLFYTPYMHLSTPNLQFLQKNLAEFDYILD